MQSKAPGHESAAPALPFPFPLKGGGGSVNRAACIMQICAITNTYNEDFNLPIWSKYYSGQVGAQNCIVLDHGSDEGRIPADIEATVVRLPRSNFDDVRRASAVRLYAESMLKYYDAVIYSDCDELLVPDPRKYSGLRDFASQMSRSAVAAVGLNVIHDIRTEDAIDPSRPILEQRKYVQFASPMCKTLITKTPIRWGGGFHSSSQPVHFSDLYLFHLRPVDFGESLKRLAITRKLQWADANAGLHQRTDNGPLIELFGHYSHWPKSKDFQEVEAFKATVLERSTLNVHDQLHYVPLDVYINKLIEIPEWFGRPF